MSVIRWKQETKFEYHPNMKEFGERIWFQCKCGKYIDKYTGEHIETETLTWSEMEARYFGEACPTPSPREEGSE
jgi:hypothetical protein